MARWRMNWQRSENTRVITFDASNMHYENYVVPSTEVRKMPLNELSKKYNKLEGDQSELTDADAQQAD